MLMFNNYHTLYLNLISYCTIVCAISSFAILSIWYIANILQEHIYNTFCNKFLLSNSGRSLKILKELKSGVGGRAECKKSMQMQII